MRKTVTIGDLGTIITGKTPPTTNKNYYGDYAVFIKPTDISEQSKFTYETEEMYSKEAAEKYESSLVPKGAICVPCIGTIGTKMTMTHCDCYTNQSINSIVCNDKYDNEYVYYLIKNFLPGLKAYNLGTASGREYVSKSNFEKIELVAEQDKDAQIRIGKYLSRYDSLIENYQRQIKLLEEAAQRLYKEWFVDLNFPGHESTKIDDGVPDKWDKKTLEDICNLSKRVILPSDINEGCPYIGLEHMPRKDFCLSEWGHSEDINSSKFEYKEGDILFGKIRPYFHKVGFAINDGYASTDSIIMQSKTGVWALLLMTVSSEQFVNYTSQTCKEGAKMPRADWNQMKKYPVLIASDTIQKEFERRCKLIANKIKTNALQIHFLTEARDRLLPKLISGEISVETAQSVTSGLGVRKEHTGSPQATDS